jgi:hypothetical protein
MCAVPNRPASDGDPKWQIPSALEGTTQTIEPRAVLLWRNEAVICTCLTHAPDKIEIRLVVVGAVVDRQFFADADAASEFAIDKMHVYNG